MKNKILAVLIIFLCVININTTHAEENEGCFFIKSEYSDNITPLEGDVFEIIYCTKGETDWDNTSTITIDASKFCEEPAKVELPVGTYEIRRITYVGLNKGRNSYGIQAYFNSSLQGDTIYLTVGYETTKEKNNEWYGYIGVGLITDAYFMQQVDENPDITFEELEASMIEQETKENNSNVLITTEQNSVVDYDDVYEEDDYYSDDYGAEIQGQTDKEPEIEIHATTEENRESNITENNKMENTILKGVLALCVVVIGILGAYMIKKYM